MINIDESPVLTEEGVWTQFRGSRVKIAHVSSMIFQKKLARLQQPYAKKIMAGKLSPDIQKEILCSAMAGTILRDAEFVDSKGNPVAFSDDLAERVLFNQVDVSEFVTEFAADLENYREEVVKETGKS